MGRNDAFYILVRMYGLPTTPERGVEVGRKGEE